ncbi:MAG: methyltransferase, partial [Candidatus Paceibacterota bacterium]
ARAYTESEARRIAALRDFTRTLRQDGPVVLWGAGAKGVTFAQLIDPGRELIARVVDVNPMKQGRYLPGTGHEICGPERLTESETHTALVLNPNYFSEISATVKELRGAITPIDVMAHLGEYACN